MKSIFTLLLFVFSLQAFGQEGSKPLDFRFGIGRSILGSGDMLTTTLENELNYRLTPYFATALSLNYGRSNTGVFETASYLQGNWSVFVSPFRNSGKNDFRIGTGISLYNVSDAYTGASRYNPLTGEMDTEVEFDIRSSYGYNIILEDTYTIKNKYLIGLKLFTQPYFNGDINSGALLKLGVKL